LADGYVGKSRSGVLAVGGINDGIEMAAQLAVLGLDPIRFLTCRDSFERNLMVELSKEIQKYKEMMDENMAVRIANAVGKLFG